MEKEAKNFPIGKMALIFQVSTSGYYEYIKRKPSNREKENEKIVALIKEVYQEGRGMYGSPRVHAKLLRLEIKCSRKRIARLMSKNGIAARMRKSWKRTTKSGKREAAANLVKQKFTVKAPNHTWVSDITYVQTKEGWLYVSAILDLFSRKVVGLSMGERLDSYLIERSLQQAIRHRGYANGLIHHSDRGSQYTSERFEEISRANGIILSMSSKGNCYDHAVVESFFHTLKTEHIYQKRFTTREEAKKSIFEYVEIFYNKQRMHSFLGYLSPEEYEKNWNKQVI